MTRLGERLIACVLLLVGASYGYGTLQIQGRDFTSNEIGPSAFPWVLTVLLVVLAISIFAKTWFIAARRDKKIHANADNNGWRVITAIFLLSLYVASLDRIGFLWSTPIFIVFFSALYDMRRLPLMAGLAPAVTLTIYALLRYWFGVLLP